MPYGGSSSSMVVLNGTSVVIQAPFMSALSAARTERERLVGAPLEQQVGAAAPLARGDVAEPHQRHRRREHRHDERHDDGQADGAVDDAAARRARRRRMAARRSPTDWRGLALRSDRGRRRAPARSPQDLTLAVVAGGAGVQRNRRRGRLFGIDERGFPVGAGHARAAGRRTRASAGRRPPRRGRCGRRAASPTRASRSARSGPAVRWPRWSPA